MFSCLSACVLLFCLLYVAVCSTSLVCAVRSVSKTLARELIHNVVLSHLRRLVRQTRALEVSVVVAVVALVGG